MWAGNERGFLLYMNLNLCFYSINIFFTILTIYRDVRISFGGISCCINGTARMGLQILPSNWNNYFLSLHPLAAFLSKFRLGFSRVTSQMGLKISNRYLKDILSSFIANTWLPSEKSSWSNSFYFATSLHQNILSQCKPCLAIENTSWFSLHGIIIHYLTSSTSFYEYQCKIKYIVIIEIWTVSYQVKSQI